MRLKKSMICRKCGKTCKNKYGHVFSVVLPASVRMWLCYKCGEEMLRIIGEKWNMNLLDSMEFVKKALRNERK